MVNPLAVEDLQSGSVRALATNVSTGVTQELTTRNGSSCHFFEPFECSGYEVRLRLDWKDLDDQGNPTLDADFYSLNTGAMDKSMKAHPRITHQPEPPANAPTSGSLRTSPGICE